MLTRIASSFAGALRTTALGLGVALLLPVLGGPAAWAQSTTATVPAPSRLVPIPVKATRASMTFDGSQTVLVGKVYMQMAPGVRIFGADNMLKLSATLSGTATAKYLLEPTTGLLQTIWILTDQEIQTPDPAPATTSQ